MKRSDYGDTTPSAELAALQVLVQGWANFLPREQQVLLKFDRRAVPGADVWCVLVMHVISESSNMKSGQKRAFISTLALS